MQARALPMEQWRDVRGYRAGVQGDDAEDKTHAAIFIGGGEVCQGNRDES